MFGVWVGRGSNGCSVFLYKKLKLTFPKGPVCRKLHSGFFGFIFRYRHHSGQSAYHLV